MTKETNNNIKINYKFTIYSYDTENMEINTIDNLNGEFPPDTLFPNMIDYLVKKHKIKCMQINVEDLKTNTWNKITDEELHLYIPGDDYHYKWFDYKLGDIQTKFKLFDNVLNIVIDGPGIGGRLGEDEGITFIINNNEKDRHQFEPHIHCKYSGEEMRIRIDTLEIMKKDKEFQNKNKTKVAKKWVKEHQEALLKYYQEFAIEGNNDIKLKMSI